MAREYGRSIDAVEKHLERLGARREPVKAPPASSSAKPAPGWGATAFDPIAHAEAVALLQPAPGETLRQALVRVLTAPRPPDDPNDGTHHHGEGWNTGHASAALMLTAADVGERPPPSPSPSSPSGTTSISVADINPVPGVPAPTKAAYAILGDPAPKPEPVRRCVACGRPLSPQHLRVRAKGNFCSACEVMMGGAGAGP